MTEALKTDWLEQAKREIAEEQPYGIDAGFLRIGLERERARNLELREVIRIEREFSANLKRKTYDAVQTIQSIFED